MKTRLWLECLILYVALPACVLYFRSRLLMIFLFWAGAIGAAFLLGRLYKVKAWPEWNAAALRTHWRPVVRLFVIVAPLVAVAVWYLMPGQFLQLPLLRPRLWLLILLLYPPLSVVPQEILFRSWFFHRYGTILPDKQARRALSAIAFGFYHVVFLSPVSVILTLIAGYGFARSYDRSRSLALVTFEHGLWGAFAFTIGLGHYFYTGAAWAR